MNQNKVSIIVPVYNMESLLTKCINSLIHQTYNNLEIVIIDDGSLDNSGMIADEYAKHDNRIVVIHHNMNRGIACGFISGIEKASGEYVVFVDSDNFIDEKMIEVLVKTAQESQADIVQCEAFCYRDMSETPEKQPDSIRENVISFSTKKEMMNDYFLEETITNNLAAKIIKKTLFDKVVIPEGHQVVDALTLLQLINVCSYYICLPDYLYYAYQAPSSVSRSSISDRRINDLLFSIEFTEDYIRKELPAWNDYIPFKKAKVANWAYNQVCFSTSISEKDSWVRYFNSLFRDSYIEAKKTTYYRNLEPLEKLKYSFFYHCCGLYTALLTRRFR